MATLEQWKSVVGKLNSQVNRVPTFEQLQKYFSMAVYIYEDCPLDKYAFEVSGYAKAWCEKICTQAKDRKLVELCWQLYWDILKWEAPNRLDSYCIYIERNRKPQERFYLPRRKTLIKVVNKIQMLADNELDELFVHMPARVGKSQIMTLANAWNASRYPEMNNLYATYKESLGGAFLDGVTEIITDPTYLHNEVFPKCRIAGTDAKANKLWLVKKRKYATLSGKGLEAGLNGEYDCNGLMTIDDIIEGVQDVINPDILKRKQIVFDNNLMKRKKEGAKVIYNGTIWSLHDIYMNRQEFLRTNPEAKDVRWEILKIPALDPATDESNFDYDYGVGFSTKYYRMERAKFEANDDMAGWFAQCQQEPIEREGSVFNPQYMKFYNGVLPAEEPLRILAFCDVALGGTDYLSFPIGYMYEDGSTYIHDVVFDNSGKEITQPRVVEKIIRNNVGSARFEANQGGEGYKDDIERLLKEKGYRLNISSKYAPTDKRKEQRIWDKAPQIREYYFRDDGCRDTEYRKFMNNIFGFTMTGKNKHDDAPDSLAGLEDFKSNTGVRTSRIIASPL